MEKLSLPQLKEIAKAHKEHHGIKNVSTMKKGPLVEALSKVFEVKDGDVHLKEKDGDRCWEGYREVPGKKPYSKGSCVEGKGADKCDCEDECMCGGALGEKVKSALQRVRALKGKISGTGCGCEDQMAIEGDGAGSDPIDWQDIKWGSFTAQFQAWNKQHPKDKKKDLREFADMIMKDPKSFKEKTLRRARFYVNVLSKKK